MKRRKQANQLLFYGAGTGLGVNSSGAPTGETWISLPGKVVTLTSL